MRIVIVGGGVVGYSLADQLLKDNHELSLVELDTTLCHSIAEKLDLQVVNGSGSSPSVLREAGIVGADMVLAVTPNDEVNLVVCALAGQYGVRERIARLRGAEFVESGDQLDLKQLGVTSVIRPEKVLVGQVLQYVDTPHSIESANFEEGRILLRGYQVTEAMPIANRTAREIRESIAPEIVLFAAIIRKREGMIPDGETTILPGDIVYSLFPQESRDRFLQLVGADKTGRKIIITGDSYATLELAQALDREAKYHVTFANPDAVHAEKAAALCPNIEVLHGDCTEEDFLRELNVGNASFFISVSDSADYNILTALLAKAEGAHEVIATTTDMSHNRLYKSIGVDHVINPRLTTAREILEMISRGHIGAVVRLSDVDIEAVRMVVQPDSEVAGMKVRKIATRLKRGTIIGVIVRDNKMILPEGETVIEARDHVILITHHRNLPTISKLFKPRGFLRRS
ncbi:MAG TPA: Trk system potassium transporter TrkA [candidate division Zixibacteria bacterium]|nr:Trk system potassium transporter TrkA [candidate division Zixibacteria bacterium]